MKKILPCFLFLILLAQASFSQGWEKSYGGAKNEIAYDVLKTTDGGYVAVGSTNSFGAGGTDVFIVKINSSGTLKWTKVFGGAGNENAYSVAEANNGDLLIAGYTESFGAGGRDAYLIKLTANGLFKWSKTYGTASADEARTVIISGSNYYVSGTSNNNFYLVKTDTGGKKIWEKNYGTPGVETCYDMVKTFDNSLAMAGYTGGYGSNRVYLVKTNLNGDTIFTRNYYEGTSSNGAEGITETNDHGLVMTGFNYSGTGYGDLFLLKVNPGGSQVFNTIGTALANNGNKLCASSDGGVAVVGDHCNFGCTMEILKYNTGGTEQWHNSSYQYAIFNSYATFSSGHAIRKAGSGYVACGSTQLPSGNNTDFLIVKTDPGGATFPAITLSASGPTTFCAPGTLTLTAPAGYLSYQWCFVSTTHQLTYIAGANSSSYVANAKGYYSCLMKDANNNVRIGSLYLNVIPVTPATITASGPVAYCSSTGQSVTLSANPNTGYSYQWKLNGTNIPGATSVNHTPASSGNYSVVISNSCITSTSSNTAVNTAAPPPAPVISYINGITPSYYHCANGGSTIDGYMQISAIQGGSYQWFHNGIIMNGATNTTVFPYYNNENYTVTVTTACGNATSAPFTGSYFEFNHGAINISPVGPTAGCGVSSVVLNIWAFSSTYQWKLNGSPIAGANTDTYTATVSGAYSCDYDDFNCGPTESQPLQVSITASPAAAISATGSTSVCAGSVTLNATPTGAGITYSWLKDNVVISGANASVYAASSSGSYKCNVTQPSCGLSVSNQMYVSVGVPVNNTITATATTICTAASATLNVTGPQAGQTFQWKLNNSNISGATLSSYVTSVAGNYKCAITNSCGTVTSNTIAISVNPTPAAVINGNTIICPAGSVSLTAGNSPGSSFQWYKLNSVINGATQQSYSATVAAQYKVKVTGSNGCTAFSNIITTTAGSIPAASVSLSQYPVICKNDTIQLRTNQATGYSYQWKNNGSNISGATGYFHTTKAAGLYSVTVTNICGTATSSAPYPIQTKNQPSATITPQGPVTFCNGDSVVLSANVATGLQYTWLKNGNTISGATKATYTAKTAGIYKVTVSNPVGCTRNSGGIVITVPCRVNESASFASTDLKASVYPNPFADAFTLFVDGDESEIYLVSVKDITGRTVVSEKKVHAGIETRLGDELNNGFYFVEIRGANSRKVLRVEKIR